MKELKIIPPEGFEVDKEASTFECIKFKPKIKRWRDDENARFSGYHITDFSSILELDHMTNIPENYDLYATVEQANSALAMARISQIIANDSRFGGIITDEEWDSNKDKFIIERERNSITTRATVMYYHFLAFHTKQQRDLFLEENEDLIKEYLMIS